MWRSIRYEELVNGLAISTRRRAKPIHFAACRMRHQGACLPTGASEFAWAPTASKAARHAKICVALRPTFPTGCLIRKKDWSNLPARDSGRFSAMAEALSCWKCGNSLADLSPPLLRTEECRACRAELHVCRMCRFYDLTKAKQCAEPVADPVLNKERANFCGYFEPVSGRFPAG